MIAAKGIVTVAIIYYYVACAKFSTMCSLYPCFTLIPLALRGGVCCLYFTDEETGLERLDNLLRVTERGRAGIEYESLTPGSKPFMHQEHFDQELK